MSHSIKKKPMNIREEIERLEAEIKALTEKGAAFDGFRATFDAKLKEIEQIDLTDDIARMVREGADEVADAIARDVGALADQVQARSE